MSADDETYDKRCIGCLNEGTGCMWCFEDEDDDFESIEDEWP